MTRFKASSGGESKACRLSDGGGCAVTSNNNPSGSTKAEEELAPPAPKAPAAVTICTPLVLLTRTPDAGKRVVDEENEEEVGGSGTE